PAAAPVDPPARPSPAAAPGGPSPAAGPERASPVAGRERADGQVCEQSAAWIPLPAGESLTVKNPLGSLRLRGSDGAGVRITAVKRARNPALLERLKTEVKVEDGRVEITAVVGFADGSFRAVPLAGAGIDLTIEAPRRLAISAATFGGEIDAAGFRSGA